MAIKSNLLGAVAAVDAALRRKNEAAAFIVEGAAKRRCPVDSGRLRASITHEADEDGFIVGTNVEYGSFIELGTRYAPPQAFLVPGLQDSIGAVRAVYEA